MIEETIKSLIGLQDTYIGEAPIDKSDCQWIRLISGISTNHFNKDTYDMPNYMVFCRGSVHREVLTRINAIYDRLKNYVGNNYVIVIKRLPQYVGRDEKDRVIYSITIEYQLGGY